jgi:hypothetical protein
MEFKCVYDYSEQYKVKDNLTVWKGIGLDKLESLLKNTAMFFAKPIALEHNLEDSYSH